MFADICIGNEKFSGIASKLSTDTLFFCQKEKARLAFTYKDRKVSIHEGIPPGKNAICFLTLDFLDSKITQVHVKDIASRNLLVGIPFRMILREKNREKVIGRLSFVLRLFTKYNVKFFFASFADDPYELRAKKEMMSFLQVLGANQQSIVNSSNALIEFLEQ